MICEKCQQEMVNTFQKEQYVPIDNKVGKDWLTALLLCIFLGALGAHRFYVGKIGTGILQLVTIGGFGIWVLIDLILIIVGTFKDKNGNVLLKS